MDVFQAIILSIVEGIAEFLPISSTGHLVLTANILNIEQTEFVKTFEIVIQLGAILAIVVLYWKKLTRNFEVWKRIITAFIPTAIVGIVLYKFIKSILIGNTLITLLALFVGGIILIFLELLYKETEHHTDKIEKLPIRNAIGIGLVQSLSVIPGVSRAAASIIGGLFMGVQRTTAVEFSFLLAVPTMIAATGLDLVETKLQFSSQEFLLLGVGFVGSFIVAILAVKFFLQYIKQHNFIAFGIYRIVLAVLYYFFIIM